MKAQKCYRVILQVYDKSNPKESISEVCVVDSTLEAPTNCLNFSMGMHNQIKLIQGVQDNVLEASPILTYATNLYTLSSTLFQSLTHDSLR